MHGSVEWWCRGMNFLFQHFVTTHNQLDLRFHNPCSVIVWRCGKHGLGFRIVKGVYSILVVVAIENQIEAGHILSHFLGTVFQSVIAFHTTFKSAMEKADNEMRLLLFLDNGYPLLRTFHHILKAQATPKRIRQPIVDCGRNHAKNGDSDATTLNDRVRLKIGLLRLDVNHVCSQHGIVAFGKPFIVDGMAGFDVMVANGCGIVTDGIHHLIYNVLLTVYIVVIIRYRLSLQTIASICTDNAIRIPLSERFNISIDRTCATMCPDALQVVIHEHVAVQITGVYPTKRYLFDRFISHYYFLWKCSSSDILQMSSSPFCSTIK